MALYFRSPSLNGALLFANPFAGLIAQNQPPTANNQIFSIIVTAKNGTTVGQFVAVDGDGEVVDFAISNSKLSISKTGLIVLEDNSGLMVGTPIVATVIFADDIDGTGSARVTINVLAAPPNLPIITAPAPLTVIYPSDLSKLPISHIDVQKWLQSWSAVDVDQNPLELSFNLPSLLLVANSPITVTATAIDSALRVQTESSTITIQELSNVNSLPVMVDGTPNRYEQKGSRYYELDD